MRYLMAYIHLVKITGPELCLSLHFYRVGISSVYFSTLFVTALAHTFLTATTLLPVNSQKLNVCLCTPGRQEDRPTLTFSLGTRYRWVVIFTSRPLYLGNLLNGNLGGSQSPAGLFAEDTSPCSNLNENWNCLQDSNWSSVHTGWCRVTWR